MASLRRAPAPIRAGADLLAGPLAALRAERFLNPDGLVYRATLTIDARGRPLPEADILRDGARHRALVRFSRSVGLPQPLTDLLGLSIRLEHAYGQGRHQDFLLFSSGGRPGLRHLFLPARSFFGASFSSVVPYRVGRGVAVVGALPTTAPVRSGDETDLADLAATADAGDLRFRFALSTPWGRWRPVGLVSVGDRVRSRRLKSIHYSPWNSGGGIVPVDPLGPLRRPLLEAEQDGDGVD